MTKKAYFVPFLLKKVRIVEILSNFLTKKNFNQTVQQRSSIFNEINKTSIQISTCF